MHGSLGNRSSLVAQIGILQSEYSQDDRFTYTGTLLERFETTNDILCNY